MSYNYDPELAAPAGTSAGRVTGHQRPGAGPRGFPEMIDQLNAELDTSGVDIENRASQAPKARRMCRAHLHTGGPGAGRCPAYCTFTAVALSSATWTVSSAAASPCAATSAWWWSPWTTDWHPRHPIRAAWKTATPRCSGCSDNSAELQYDPARLAFLARVPAAACLRRPACWPGTVLARNLLPVPGHSRTGRPPANPQHAAFCRHTHVEPAQRRTELGLSTWETTTSAAPTTCPTTRLQPGPRICAGCPRLISAPWNSTPCGTRAWSTPCN